MPKRSKSCEFSFLVPIGKKRSMLPPPGFPGKYHDRLEQVMRARQIVGQGGQLPFRKKQIKGRKKNSRKKKRPARRSLYLSHIPTSIIEAIRAGPCEGGARGTRWRQGGVHPGPRKGGGCGRPRFIVEHDEVGNCELRERRASPVQAEPLLPASPDRAATGAGAPSSGRSPQPAILTISTPIGRGRLKRTLLAKCILSLVSG